MVAFGIKGIKSQVAKLIFGRGRNRLGSGHGRGGRSGGCGGVCDRGLVVWRLRRKILNLFDMSDVFTRFRLFSFSEVLG